jgi:hypothetical protein
MLEKLLNHMTGIVNNLNDDDFLQKVGYCASDRDCGYKSSLKRLGINRSAKTDAIANHVIYHRHDDIPAEFLDDSPAQLRLEI